MENGEKDCTDCIRPPQMDDDTDIFNTSGNYRRYEESVMSGKVYSIDDVGIEGEVAGM